MNTSGLITCKFSREFPSCISHLLIDTQRGDTVLRNITTLSICYTMPNVLVYINSVNVPLFKIVQRRARERKQARIPLGPGGFA